MCCTDKTLWNLTDRDGAAIPERRLTGSGAELSRAEERQAPKTSQDSCFSSGVGGKSGSDNLLEDADKVAGVPSCGAGSGVCSVPAQRSVQRRTSLRFTVHVRRVGSADRTSAIGLGSKCKQDRMRKSGLSDDQTHTRRRPLTFNHLSTHLAWNSWLQGKTRSSCRHSKSLKHTTQLWEEEKRRGLR